MEYEYNLAYKIRAELLKYKILIFLIKNYFKLSEFMNIKFYPFAVCKLLWTVDYKISCYQLNDKQKKLDDEFSKLLKEAH